MTDPQPPAADDPPDPDQGREWVEFIGKELDREYTRRDTINTRSAASITSATALVTISLAVIAVIRGEHYTVGLAAWTVWLLGGALVCLAARLRRDGAAPVGALAVFEEAGRGVADMIEALVDWAAVADKPTVRRFRPRFFVTGLQDPMTDPADPHYFARRAAESEAKRRRIVAEVARAAGPNDDIDYLTKRELYRAGLISASELHATGSPELMPRVVLVPALRRSDRRVLPHSRLLTS
ncbi:hypothetical protein AOT83_23780 [Mycobacteroides sp. H001]|uniref:hypothetical protein n=1 Tax=Mycobacteroides TaxID=670516 RepID=UPI000715106B|nr:MULTISPECIES: hypothetical protein [Mycobacteroides]KRQ29542.1 hypothetical protein AOT86_05735 [Mycobacteroides sp. H072]KRQ37083.1 hypothetical protein AOT84_12580 [Mycobacteroides sp. H002]KRQ55656.1 hypothetical protein AOT85_01685 [Mycobacteroides sp. H054]KRQ66265.1 hypothetical protein AOT83_23780 [Mycobacteroides sp. H001]OHU32654.1 hypothetical protein BKG79_23990 [Mycobacteroides chelonae]